MKTLSRVGLPAPPGGAPGGGSPRGWGVGDGDGSVVPGITGCMVEVLCSGSPRLRVRLAVLLPLAWWEGAFCRSDICC